MKGKKAGSAANLKRSLKSGSSDYLLRVAADTEIEIRILKEPEEWFEYEEHYSDVHKFFPCDDTECIGCEEGLKTSKKVALPVYDIGNETVRVMAAPKGVAEKFLAKYDRYKTLLDRNYLVVREGSTQENTTYEVETQPPTKMKLVKLAAKVPDLEEMIASQIPSPDDDDDFMPPRQRGKKKTSTSKKPTARRTIRSDDDDEDYTPPRRHVAKKTAKKVVKKKGRSLS